MTLFKASLAIVAVAALSQAAFAQTTVVHVTGSTAFRASTQTAILNMMNITAAGDGYAYNGTSFTGATYSIFKGTVPGVTGKVIVKTSWSGAVAGIRDVSQSLNVSFLPDGTTISNATGGQASAPTTGLVSAIPDVAMADNYQSSTKFTTPTLTRSIVGIVPFAWVASKDAPVGITNVTPQLARALFRSGFASAALFTNNDADASDKVGGTTVYAIGRDPFSGTRLVTFAESGVGVNTVVAQYEPIAASITSNTIGQIRLTLADVANNVAAGDNGYSSGGTLADQMRYSTPAVEDTNNNPGNTAKIAFVTYLGEGDAVRAVFGTGSSVTGTNAGNGRYLSYNGVAAWGGIATSFANASVTTGSNVVTVTGSTTGLVPGQFLRATGTNASFFPANSTILAITSGTTFTISANATGTGSVGSVSTSTLLPQGIRNGSYTFWGYEQIMWRSSLASGQLTVATTLRDQIKTTDYFLSGLPDDTSVRVSRTTDGGTVTQKY